MWHGRCAPCLLCSVRSALCVWVQRLRTWWCWTSTTSTPRSRAQTSRSLSSSRRQYSNECGRSGAEQCRAVQCTNPVGPPFLTFGFLCAAVFLPVAICCSCVVVQLVRTLQDARSQLCPRRHRPQGSCQGQKRTEWPKRRALCLSDFLLCRLSPSSFFFYFFFCASFCFTCVCSVFVFSWRIQLASVDCTVEKDLCSRYGVQGFPSPLDTQRLSCCAVAARCDPLQRIRSR